MTDHICKLGTYIASPAFKVAGFGHSCLKSSHSAQDVYTVKLICNSLTILRLPACDQYGHPNIAALTLKVLPFVGLLYFHIYIVSGGGGRLFNQTKLKHFQGKRCKLESKKLLCVVDLPISLLKNTLYSIDYRNSIMQIFFHTTLKIRLSLLMDYTGSFGAWL